MKVGVIGTGFGSRVVAGAFRESGCEVVDVVTARDPDAVRALCRAPVDLVAVHSPPFLHAQYVTWAVEAGHAVLCDKPFGTSMADATSMAAVAADAGVANFVNFEFRHQPARRAMADLIAAGAVGSPEHLTYVALTSGSRVPLRPWGWLFDRAKGGGWIGAFGSHAIDLVRWLLGDVRRAGATTWVNIADRPDPDGHLHACDAEDSFVGWMELDSGATASIDSSFTAGAAVTPRIVVVGTDGAIENIGDARVVVHRRDARPETQEFPPRTGDSHSVAMAAWAAAMRAAVLEGAPVGPSFRDGVACMRVMEQWRKDPPRRAEAASGSRVPSPHVEDRPSRSSRPGGA